MSLRNLGTAVVLATAAWSCGVYAAPGSAWVGGWGAATCGDLLAKVDQQPSYKVVFTEWLQGFISGENVSRSAKGNSLVGARTSGDTLQELWLSTCRQPGNVPKHFADVAKGIYEALRSGGG